MRRFRWLVAFVVLGTALGAQADQDFDEPAVLLKNIREDPSPQDSEPENFVMVGDHIVFTADDGSKSVDYGRLTVVLMQAIKGQQSELDLVKAENASLSARLDKIEQALADK